MKPIHGNRFARLWVLLLLVSAGSWLPSGAQGQDRQHTPESLLTAARAIMAGADNCALITVDESGRPQVRTMDPFTPDDDMTVWFGTHRGTRKVAHIRENPGVTLYYAAPGGVGYVTMSGTARLVDDPAEKAKRWKEEWELFYEDAETDYLLIEVRPEVLEIIDYSQGIVGDRQTWRAPTVQFGVKSAEP